MLLGLSVLLGNSPTIDLMGIFVGHTYYFLEDVYPNMPAGAGKKPLRAPYVLQRLVGETEAMQPVQTVAPRVEMAPGAHVD